MEKISCSERLKLGLEGRSLKPSDLSRMTDISKATISQYLKGLYEPGQVKLELISRALNVSEAWLMGYDVPMERKEPATNEGDGLSEEGIKYAEKISRLSPEGKQKLRDYLEFLELKDNQ